MNEFLRGKAILMTGAARQLGRVFALTCAHAGADVVIHLPYTITKAGLASLTRSLAVALSPNITVHGLALGAILTPTDSNSKPDIIKYVPLKRWANISEVEEALLFLLTWPMYITGEILYLDGGRHLV